jgi:hypothetical protein
VTKIFPPAATIPPIGAYIWNPRLISGIRRPVGKMSNRVPSLRNPKMRTSLSPTPDSATSSDPSASNAIADGAVSPVMYRRSSNPGGYSTSARSIDG